MANSNNIFTGAIAILKDRLGNTVGYMNDISISEQLSRVPYYQIGSIYRVEAPVVTHSGSGSFSYASINLKKYAGDPNSVIPGLGREMIIRDVDRAQFETQVTLDDAGTQLYIYKKIIDVIDPVTRIINAEAIPFMALNNITIESNSWTISQGNIVMENQTFSFGEPILI